MDETRWTVCAGSWIFAIVGDICTNSDRALSALAILHFVGLAFCRDRHDAIKCRRIDATDVPVDTKMDSTIAVVLGIRVYVMVCVSCDNQGRNTWGQLGVFLANPCAARARRDRVDWAYLLVARPCFADEPGFGCSAMQHCDVGNGDVGLFCLCPALEAFCSRKSWSSKPGVLVFHLVAHDSLVIRDVSVRTRFV